MSLGQTTFSIIMQVNAKMIYTKSSKYLFYPILSVIDNRQHLVLPTDNENFRNYLLVRPNIRVDYDLLIDTYKEEDYQSDSLIYIQQN